MKSRRPVGRALLAILLCLIAGGAFYWWRTNGSRETRKAESAETSQTASAEFTPTDAQWATLSVAPVQSVVFRPSQVTEAKIAVDEDHATPIFAPYTGRVVKLLAKPGDAIRTGQLLFVIEATDMVQAQNDFLTALAAANKARSQVNLTHTVEKRLHDLYDVKAMSLRELQQAQADLTAAQSDLRSAETQFEATRNRLRILGKTGDEIAPFQTTGKISAETPIYAPIGGTIVQRKVGPGQYVTSGSADPIFVIGDLSTVWLVAYVRETEASEVSTGQSIEFTPLAYAGETFRGNITYVSAVLDSSTRRLLVRATIQNQNQRLKPEMFASVTIFTGEGDAAPAVPREAVIYEGDSARVWVARPNKSIELRKVQLGAINGRMIQVLQGLRLGESVITKGSLFIDRAASGS